MNDNQRIAILRNALLLIGIQLDMESPDLRYHEK